MSFYPPPPFGRPRGRDPQALRRLLELAAQAAAAVLALVRALRRPS